MKYIISTEMRKLCFLSSTPIKKGEEFLVCYFHKNKYSDVVLVDKPHVCVWENESFPSNLVVKKDTFLYNYAYNKMSKGFREQFEKTLRIEYGDIGVEYCFLNKNVYDNLHNIFDQNDLNKIAKELGDYEKRIEEIESTIFQYSPGDKEYQYAKSTAELMKIPHPSENDIITRLFSGPSPIITHQALKNLIVSGQDVEILKICALNETMKSLGKEFTMAKSVDVQDSLKDPKDVINMINKIIK